MAPITAWRLVKTRFAPSAFSGHGARLHGGRWNSVGVSVAYASGSMALATLEVMVGVQNAALLDSYSLCGARFDEGFVENLSADQLPVDWHDHPPSPSTQLIGDAWVSSGRSLVLRVPSAVIESEPNYLINPAHADFNQVQVLAPTPYMVDSRLIGKPGAA